MLAAAARGELSKTLALEGGMPSILWAGKKKQVTKTKYPLRLAFTQSDDLNYELACGMPLLSLSFFTLDPLVKEEYIWMGESRRPSNTLLERKTASVWITELKGAKAVYPVSLSQSESVLSQLKEPHRYPEIFALSCEIRQWRFYHNFRTDADSPLRSPQIGVRTELSNDGHDLAAALQTIIEIGDQELLYKMVDSAFPGAQLSISVDSKTRFEILLHMPGIQRPLEAREFSDGCLRYLCWLAVLLSPRPPRLLALNEPEMRLHPELLQPLSELITLAARYSQIWVTTHSQKLAQMITETSGKDSINLVNTGLGTQIKGIEIYEQFF